MSGFNHLLLLSFVLLFSACRQGENAQKESASGQEISPDTILQMPQKAAPLATGWMTPVRLTGVDTRVPLTQYFSDPSQIDSLTPSPGIGARLSSGNDEVTITIVGDIGFLSTLRFWSDGEPYDLLLEAPVAKKKAVLRLRDQGFKEVMVKGEMNGWDSKAGVMKKNNGIWERSFELAPGQYPYVFIVDGKEMQDPKNPQKTSDGRSLLALREPASGKMPEIAVAGTEGNLIELRKSTPCAIKAFWEYKLLETSVENGKTFVTIPEEAALRDQSSIHVFAQNEAGVSQELVIGLREGRVADSQ